MADLNRETV